MNDSKSELREVFPSNLSASSSLKLIGRILEKEMGHPNDGNLAISDGKYSISRYQQWLAEGYISEKTHTGSGKRNFSFLELVWMSIICALEANGFSNEKIRKIKNALSINSDTFSISEMPFLELACFSALSSTEPIVLYVSSEGGVEIQKPLSVGLNKKCVYKPPCFKVHLNDLLNNLMSEGKLWPVNNLFRYCTEKELSVLDSLGREGVEKVSVSLKNGSPVLIKQVMSLHSLDVKKLPFEFGELNIKIHQGEVSRVVATKSYRV